MTRRSILAVFGLAPLAACRKAAQLPADVFPAMVAGVWRRTDLRDVGASEAPDPVPRNEIERLQQAAYEGPGKLEARVYVLSSPEVGKVLSERWQPSADTVFFDRGPYFVVIKWQAAERQALQAFVKSLEQRLAAAGQGEAER